MNTNQNIYVTESTITQQTLKFTFISQGDHDIIKAVQYGYVTDLDARHVYNLGFGDYDVVNDTIDDEINTNNGDSRKVFNTVLHTIPLFFDRFMNVILMVQGSDSRPDFPGKCTKTCKKKCGDECRKFKQRIRIYTSFVDQHFETLCLDYQFHGGITTSDGRTMMVQYEKHKDYDAVFVTRKKM